MWVTLKIVCENDNTTVVVTISRPRGDRIDLKIGTHVHDRNVYDLCGHNSLPFLGPFKAKFDLERP